MVAAMALESVDPNGVNGESEYPQAPKRADASTLAGVPGGVYPDAKTGTRTHRAQAGIAEPIEPSRHIHRHLRRLAAGQAARKG